MSYLEDEVRSLFGRAVHHYRLIGDRDRVAVGLSGGKDSLSLLWLLADRRRRVPISFSLVALWVDLGLEGVDGEALERACRGVEVDLVRIRAGWKPEELGSCYACARARRRLLLEAAEGAGAGVVALGHNLDDLIETHFLSLIHNSRSEALLPASRLMEGRFKVIRPLLLVPAAKLARFARAKNLPVQANPCPLARTSARAGVREGLSALLALHPRARENIFRGLTRWDPDRFPAPLGTGPLED